MQDFTDKRVPSFADECTARLYCMVWWARRALGSCKPPFHRQPGRQLRPPAEAGPVCSQAGEMGGRLLLLPTLLLVPLATVTVRTRVISRIQPGAAFVTLDGSLFSTTGLEGANFPHREGAAV
jgi:hypothetical protein